MKLRPVKWKDRKYLYYVLKERLNESTTNISHQGLPKWKDHILFILKYFLGFPVGMGVKYSKWYIIEADGRLIGTAYLTSRNEVGIYIEEGRRWKGIGSKALQYLVQKHKLKYYLANINPENTPSLGFFKNHGFRLVQFTYRRDND